MQASGRNDDEHKGRPRVGWGRGLSESLRASGLVWVEEDGFQGGLGVGGFFCGLGFWTVALWQSGLGVCGFTASGFGSGRGSLLRQSSGLGL